MEFTQVGPRRVEAADGTAVELIDRHHARLTSPTGTWIAEIGAGWDEDWLAINVFADSLLRSGGDPDLRARERALETIVHGLRSLRVRVQLQDALGDEVAEVISAAHPDPTPGEMPD